MGMPSRWEALGMDGCTSSVTDIDPSTSANLRILSAWKIASGDTVTFSTRESLGAMDTTAMESRP